MTDEKDECTHCGYEWTYTGDMPVGAYITCPACRNATKLEESVDTEP